jgi:hypothetical protein
VFFLIKIPNIELKKSIVSQQQHLMKKMLLQISALFVIQERSGGILDEVCLCDGNVA